MSEEPVVDEADEPGQDRFLLVSILVLILLHPLLVENAWGRGLLSLLTLVPLIIAMVRMSKKKELVWPFAALIVGTLACAVAAYFTGSHELTAMKWALATVGFAVSVAGLFTYLKDASETRITAGHLFTAASIYLLLVVMFFTLYSAINAIFPDAFSGGSASQPVDLLYFSLCTLTTVGYGDIVPVRGMVRMIAGLEAVAGVLYVAITVSVLVSGYQGRTRT